MIATLASILLIGSSGGSSLNVWPNECAPLDRQAINAAMKSSGNRRSFQSEEKGVRYQPILVVELRDSMPWDTLVDGAWACLPPPGAHTEIRGLRGVIDNQAVIRTSTGFSCYRGYGTRPSAARIAVTQLSTMQEAVSALANMGAGAVAVRVRRVAIPDANLGDEAQKVSGGASPAIEFRVGQIVASASLNVPNTQVGEEAVLDLARAVEFRIHASGLLGDRTRSFTLSNGKVLQGLTTGHGYVPLSELARLNVNVSNYDDSGGRWAQVKLGSKTLRIDEYRTRLTVNGQERDCPSAIPYRGDLWVPVRAVVEALGFTITG